MVEAFYGSRDLKITQNMNPQVRSGMRMMKTRNMTHNSLRHTRYCLFLVRRIDNNDVDDNFMSMNEFWWHALL